MMKTKFFLFLVGLFSLAPLSSCSDNDSNNSFVGKWQVMRIEYIKESSTGTSAIVKDYSSDNWVLTFHSNGRLDGFWNHTIYSYDDQRLLFHDTHDHMENTYEYSFSDDKKSLRLKLIKYDSGDINFARSQTRSYRTYGTTTFLKRIEKSN